MRHLTWTTTPQAPIASPASDSDVATPAAFSAGVVSPYSNIRRDSVVRRRFNHGEPGSRRFRRWENEMSVRGPPRRVRAGSASDVDDGDDEPFDYTIAPQNETPFSRLHNEPAVLHMIRPLTDITEDHHSRLMGALHKAVRRIVRKRRERLRRHAATTPSVVVPARFSDVSTEWDSDAANSWARRERARTELAAVEAGALGVSSDDVLACKRLALRRQHVASRCFRRVDRKIRHALRLYDAPFFRELERVIVAFVKAEALPATLPAPCSQLDEQALCFTFTDSFHRLVCHAVAQFHRVPCFSRTTELAERVTVVSRPERVRGCALGLVCADVFAEMRHDRTAEQRD